MVSGAGHYQVINVISMKKTLLLVVLLLSGLLKVAGQDVQIATRYGDIVVRLEPEKAPATVANFIKYVEEGYYRGGSFFRTVRDDNQPDNPVKIAVIQAEVHPWYRNFLFGPIPLERTSQTGLKHENGTISMARDKPDSAQDSFFICIGDQPELDYGGRRNPDGQGFAAFGKVIEGMDVVLKINQAHAEGQALMPPVLIIDMKVVQ